MSNIKCESKNCKCINIRIAIIFLIVGLLIGGAIVFLINHMGVKTISAEEAGEKVLNVINQHMLAPGITASLVGAVSERGLHRMTLNIEAEGHPAQKEIVYVTKDGALLFPQMAAVDLEALIAAQPPEPTKCEKFQAELTPERKVKIAQCLTERGYKIYYADWCPFCRDQKALFGDAAKYLYAFDCFDPGGAPGNTAKCPDLPGVPAWRDRYGNQLKYNGQIVDGMIQIRRLVVISGCDF